MGASGGWGVEGSLHTMMAQGGGGAFQVYFGALKVYFIEGGAFSQYEVLFDWDLFYIFFTLNLIYVASFQKFPHAGYLNDIQIEVIISGYRTLEN